jgi:hypothetical protein
LKLGKENGSSETIAVISVTALPWLEGDNLF